MKQLVLKLYLYLPVIALLLGLWFVFAATDSYRYACQDPANWEDPVCQVPMCTATGACTENLVYNGEAAAQVLETSPEILNPDPCGDAGVPEQLDQSLTNIETMEETNE